jgi:hypothetical protein
MIEGREYGFQEKSDKIQLVITNKKEIHEIG